MNRFKFLFLTLALLISAACFAGPIRLGTTYFMPAGRTNPVFLDAKTDTSGNLVMAVQADVTGGGKQIVVTRFNAAGTRQWSSTINTPVAVSAAGPLAGKFQLMLDGSGNTYVISPRDGNPVISGTTEDLLLRKINSSGATVGYLSLVGYLQEATGQTFDVVNAQMQNGPRASQELTLALTARGFSPHLHHVFILSLQGDVSGSAISVAGNYWVEADVWNNWPTSLSSDEYKLVAVVAGQSNLAEAGGATTRIVMQTLSRYEEPEYLSETTSYGSGAFWFTEGYCNLSGEAGSLNYNVSNINMEGIGSHSSQTIVLSRNDSDTPLIDRFTTSAAKSVISVPSSVPYAAARVGDNWMVYGMRTTGDGEFMMKYPSTGELSMAPWSFISAATTAPQYVGASLTSTGSRVYLAGGPTQNGFQSLYSCFNEHLEFHYSAELNVPFTLSTSRVLPVTGNRFWTVGVTSTGLQAAILWEEPKYFVGITAASTTANRGDTVFMKAHLTTPAPAGGYTFNVSVSSNLENAPRTVTVPAGTNFAKFSVKVKSAAVTGSATVTARTNSTHDINTAHTATFSIN